MTNATADHSTMFELTILEDLEFEPPCDGLPHMEPCDRTATWQAVFSCGHTRLWCDGHKDRALSIVGDNMAGTITCLDCWKALGHHKKDSHVKILFIESRKSA